jgi:hypothetical protein
MNVTKSDLFYVLMSILVASIGVVAVSNPNSRIGLYGLMGLVGIAVIMAIVIKPSLGGTFLSLRLSPISRICLPNKAILASLSLWSRS